MRIREVYNISTAIPDSKIDIPTVIKYLLSGYTELRQIAEDVTLCFADKPEGRYYFLLRDKQEVVGWAKISPKNILDKDYDHLDFTYVVPSHRGSNAIKLLLYALKEETPHPLIADGVLFRDGQRIMLKFLDKSIFNVKVLNKLTGEPEPFVELVNDADKCYLLKETHLGYGAQFLPESLMGVCWYFSLYD